MNKPLLWILVSLTSPLGICARGQDAGVNNAGVSVDPGVKHNAGVEDDCIPRALRYVRDAGQGWIDARGCVSCHQVPSLIWSHEAAARSGIMVPVDRLEAWKTWSTDVVNFVKPAQKSDCDRDATMKSNIDTMTAMLLAIPSTDGVPQTEKKKWRTEFANMLASQQADDGSWNACGQLPMQRRPALETQATTTLWATLALLVEGTSFNKDAAIEFADGAAEAQSAEWHAVRLLVAAESGDESLADFQTRLLDRQNEDGGWGWKAGEPSDALGTGYALYALAKTNSSPNRLNAARDFLHRTQSESGKWIVPGTKKSAAGKPTATANDWGTAWAVIALTQQNVSTKN